MSFISSPKLKDLKCQLQEEVKQMMSVHFRAPNAIRTQNVKSESPQRPTRAPMIASCSPFGPQVCFIILYVTDYSYSLICDVFVFPSGARNGCSNSSSKYGVSLQVLEASPRRIGRIHGSITILPIW